jgi:hypothetical protein
VREGDRLHAAAGREVKTQHALPGFAYTRLSAYPIHWPIRYQVSPARDANYSVFGSLGADAVCANYTMCPPGKYPNASGSRTTDRECAPCPAGTYGVDGERCTMCTLGVDYSPAEGATACLPCTVCDDAASTATIEPGWANCSANSTSCGVAFRSTCTIAEVIVPAVR